MIVDTSALVAIVMGESDADLLVETLLGATSLSISAATYVECGIVVDRRASPAGRRRFDELLRVLGVRVRDVAAEEARVAREAYRDFGRGSGHPAGLNLGDCFSYAAAITADEPLLYKGEDFAHTDVRPALSR